MFQIKSHESIIKSSPLIILDSNISTEAMEECLKLAEKHRVPGQYKMIYLMLIT